MNEAKNTLQQIQPRWHRRFLRAAGAPACGLVLLGAMGGCGRYTHPRKHVDLPPEQLEARLSKGARWLYYHIDVTDDQRLKIDALFKELTPEVTRLQKERKTLLDQFIQALEADQVSAEGLAMLKANGLKLTEDLLDGGVNVLYKLSQVLTAEQRKKLVEKWKMERDDS